MISSYEELLQYVRKLENALAVRENENGVTTTEVGGHLEVDGNVTANNTPHFYDINIRLRNSADNNAFDFKYRLITSKNDLMKYDNTHELSQDIFNELAYENLIVVDDGPERFIYFRFFDEDTITISGNDNYDSYDIEYSNMTNIGISVKQIF